MILFKKMCTICFKIVILSSMIFCISCSNRKKEAEINFDRKTMLQNYANQIIMPNLQNLNIETLRLDSLIYVFSKSSNLNNLILVQNQFKIAYKNYQCCDMYSFGPGFELLEGELYLALNTYPTNINKIESSIAANDSSTKYNDKRGFPALDYLLFSESNANLITKFSDRKRISYLKAVSKHLKDLVSKVTNNWVGYESEFVTKTGLDIGSSTSIIYNQMLASFERTKNFSINLPLGKFVGSPTTNPEKLPGYYSGISTELILESIEATDRFWAGKTVNNIDGLGFDDYLEVSERGKGISNNTKSQIKIVKEKINLLPIGTTLKDVILSGNKTITDQIYSEVAKTTKFYKTELPSELGLSIVFGTGDGD